jgi:hypothetical protein
MNYGSCRVRIAEFSVGSAEIVETNDSRWKFMVAGPTVASTINAYLAFRAVLVAIENFNKVLGRRAIDSLVLCDAVILGLA